MDRKLDATVERMSRWAVARHSQTRIENEVHPDRDALSVAGIIASTSALLADTAVTPAEVEKIKAALEAWGCTGGKMEKETEGSGYFEVDDAKAGTGNTTSSSTRTSRSPA